jgi:hypothetical protein
MIQLGHRLMKASNGIGHKFGSAAHVIGHKYIPQVVNGLNTALTVANNVQKVKNLLTRGR